MESDKKGNDLASDLELARLAVARRLHTMSYFEYAVDRPQWLYNHREPVEGLEFTHEPPVLRFFFGKLKPKGDDWGQKFADVFRADFASGS